MAFDSQGAFIGSGGLLQVGAGIAGGLAQAGFAKQEAQIQTQEIQTQQAENNLMRTAMEFQSRRLQTENVRKAQLARSMALSIGSAQGAQFGSGVAAGMGQASAAGAFANLGVSTSTQFGEQKFNLADQLSAEKIAMAQTQGKAAESKAMFGMLGELGKDSGSIFKGLSGLSSLFPVV